MSLFFSRFVKLSVRKKNGRPFSSSLETPYFLLGGEGVGVSVNGDRIMNHKFFDPRCGDTVKFTDKTLPKKLYETTDMIGSSRGWAGFFNHTDGTITLSDLFSPWSSNSKSSPKVITLPPFVDFQSFTVRAVVNVSLSSSPDQDDDYVVAIKFFGSQLSLCRPGRDSKWTNIQTRCFLNSDVVYSEKDQMFYMLTNGGHYLGSWDLNGNNRYYEKLHFTNLPEMSQSEWEILDSCFKEEHFVESPSGDRFIVRWYSEVYNQGDKDLFRKTKRFMVFRQDDDKRGTVSYTEDIGDHCIFFGKSETFCLKASTYPGIFANTIYYAGPGFGFYNIKNRWLHRYEPLDAPKKITAPYWIPPRSSG